MSFFMHILFFLFFYFFSVSPPLAFPATAMANDETIDVRLQFINDLDPFVSISDRQPMLPLRYPLVLNQSIGEQLPDIIRKLRSPHKVRFYKNVIVF